LAVPLDVQLVSFDFIHKNSDQETAGINKACSVCTVLIQHCNVTEYTTMVTRKTRVGYSVSLELLRCQCWHSEIYSHQNGQIYIGLYNRLHKTTVKLADR